MKLNILTAKFFNSRKSSLCESQQLVDTFMKYNVLVLRLQFTIYKDELKKKKKKTNFYVLVELVGSYMIIHDLTYDPTIFTILV